MSAFQCLDNDTIDWKQLPGVDHLWYHILDLDEENKVVDVLLRMAAGEKILLHRHTAPNNMLVIQGEHRLYEADGQLKEVRPTGRFTVSPASEEVHREGGGDVDAVILFSIRSGGGSCYELMDDDGNTVGELGWEEFKALYAA
ncbi:MAG: hypothetical protein ABJN62_19520 [Halioglobus sp.]